MSASHQSVEPPQNVDSLRKVREAERQGEARLLQRRAEVEGALQRLAADAETAVRTARTDGEATRESLLTQARSRAETEAAGILAEGRKAAEAIEVKATQTVAAKRDAVLGIVLGEFRGSA